MPFEEKLANMALDAHIAKERVLRPPVPADETNFLAGAVVYKQQCAACHGLPEQPPSDYAARALITRAASSPFITGIA